MRKRLARPFPKRNDGSTEQATGLRGGDDMHDEAPANRSRLTLGVQTLGGCRELEPGWPRAPESNRGFQELREAVLVGPPDIGHRLLIDDEEIPPIDSAGNVALSGTGPGGPGAASRTAWAWRPGFYAGTVRAELVDDAGKALGTWWLDVSPDPAKAGGGLFERMVDEIAEFDESLLVGDEPARRQLGAVGAKADSHILFERLRKRETDLHRAVTAVQREPVSVLRPRRQFVAFHQARRADLRTLRVAMRHPEACAVVQRERGAQHAFADGVGAQPRFDVPEVERRMDAPVNRCALYLLRALQRRCRDLAWKLEEEMENEEASETRTPLRCRVARRLEILGRIERRLRFAERRSPFRDAGKPELTAAGLTAVAAHPLYSRFWRVGWEALRRGVSLHDPRDPLPIAPTWEVYERWCFVEIARLLKSWLPELAWSVRREGQSRGRLGRGEGELEVDLWLQKTAPSTDGVGRADLWSVSRKCRPDLVLRWRREGSSGFVVLDTKYRTGRGAILDGMAQSAHLYHDALRWGSTGPEASLLLVPDAGAVSWLADEAYAASHGVGVVVLRPGTAPPGWLRGLLLGASASAS